MPWQENIMHYNPHSIPKKIRRKLYTKDYLLWANVDEIEIKGEIPDTGDVFTPLENEAQLLAIKGPIEQQASPQKFCSVHTRFMDESRQSHFYLLYCKGQLCGYTELVLKDFYDSALRYHTRVPRDCAMVVDLSVFAPYRGQHLGSQILRLAARSAKKLGCDTIVALVAEENAASLRAFGHMCFWPYGKLYRIVRGKYITKITEPCAQARL